MCLELHGLVTGQDVEVDPGIRGGGGGDSEAGQSLLCHSDGSLRVRATLHRYDPAGK